MRFRRPAVLSAGASSQDSKTSRERVRADLARLGVAGDLRDELARKLERLHPRLSPDAYDALLAGVALVHGIDRENERSVRQSLRDLEEVQRLLGAFTDELRKLDEALGILSTYVGRMRTRVVPAASTTLH